MAVGVATTRVQTTRSGRRICVRCANSKVSALSTMELRASSKIWYITVQNARNIGFFGTVAECHSLSASAAAASSSSSSTVVNGGADQGGEFWMSWLDFCLYHLPIFRGSAHLVIVQAPPISLDKTLYYPLYGLFSYHP